MFWKIKRGFKEIIRWPRKIKHGIKNLIIWFPVIWKDRWWDHWFIYSMLNKKLSLMEKSLRKYGHHTNAERDAHKIKVCAILFKRLMDDNYFENASRRHDEKWGEAKLSFLEIENSELLTLEINHDKVITEKDKEQERKDFKRVCKHQDNMNKQDINMVFDLMKKHIQGWWD